MVRMKSVIQHWQNREKKNYLVQFGDLLLVKYSEQQVCQRKLSADDTVRADKVLPSNRVVTSNNHGPVYYKASEAKIKPSTTFGNKWREVHKVCLEIHTWPCVTHGTGNTRVLGWLSSTGNTGTVQLKLKLTFLFPPWNLSATIAWKLLWKCSCIRLHMITTFSRVIQDV